MYAKNFLKSIEGNKKKDSNTVITETTKGTMVGAGIGAGVGLFIGFGKQKSTDERLRRSCNWWSNLKSFYKIN